MRIYRPICSGHVSPLLPPSHSILLPLFAFNVVRSLFPHSAASHHCITSDPPSLPSLPPFRQEGDLPMLSFLQGKSCCGRKFTNLRLPFKLKHWPPFVEFSSFAIRRPFVRPSPPPPPPPSALICFHGGCLLYCGEWGEGEASTIFSSRRRRRRRLSDGLAAAAAAAERGTRVTAPQILTLRRERGRDSMARAEEGKEGAHPREKEREGGGKGLGFDNQPRMQRRSTDSTRYFFKAKHITFNFW